jgi:hypothetical protein
MTDFMKYAQKKIYALKYTKLNFYSFHSLTKMPSSRTSRTSSSSSSSSSDMMNSLQQQCSEMYSKLSQVDTMSWVLLTVVSLYIAMVNPSNTPTFFSNPVFKFVLFAFVAVVFILEGPLVGTLFGIAMVLPVVYSSLREGYQNPFIERYEEKKDDDETEEGEDDTEEEEDDVEKVEDDVEKEEKEEKDVANDLSQLLQEAQEVENKVDNSNNTSDAGSKQGMVPEAQEEEAWSNYARVF